MAGKTPIEIARELLDNALLKIYPDLNEQDLERTLQLLRLNPPDECRHEDLLLAIDQAYSERTGKHRLNPNWFTLTGMLCDNRKD